MSGERAGAPAEMLQLDRSTCLALLSARRVGRLVVDDADSPVVVVNYVLRDGLIHFHSDLAGGSRRS